MNLYRDTYALINLNNLLYNANYIHNLTSKNIMAIIKADAYGNGYKEVALTLNELDYVTMFGVATIKEAIELRELNIQKDILILGAVPCKKEDILLAINNNISLTIYSTNYYEEIESLIEKGKLKIHVKCDTGMNRIGFKDEKEINDLLTNINKDKFIVEGIFTHFATADGDENKYNDQLIMFNKIIKDKSYKYIHDANSAATLYHKSDNSNILRPGIALFGVDPAGKESKELKQVMSLYSKVIAIKKIKKGETVGYSATHIANEDEYIATIPIGYADGIIRKNKGRKVYINGDYYPIVGNVCMDQLMVKVDDSIKVGDLVEFFGEHISLSTVARELDTIPYEVMCLISKRVERIYEK